MKMAWLLAGLITTFLTSGCLLVEEELDGSQLFANNCASCHGSTGSGSEGPNIRGVTASQIKRALGYVGRMNFLESKLSDDEISAIGNYLSSLGSSSKPAVTNEYFYIEIAPYNNAPGLVELKDDAGNYFSSSIDSKTLSFNRQKIHFPVMIKYIDDTGLILFALSDGNEEQVVITQELSNQLTNIADPNWIFDSCAEFQEACSSELAEAFYKSEN